LKVSDGLKNDCSICSKDPKVAELWGCLGDSPERGGFVYEVAGKPTRRCPISLFKPPAVQAALQLYRAYKRGHLPGPGNWEDQSALFCEVMFCCEGLEASAANWDLDQRQKKAERARKAQTMKGR